MRKELLLVKYPLAEARGISSRCAAFGGFDAVSVKDSPSSPCLEGQGGFWLDVLRKAGIDYGMSVLQC